ncbi:hypothetical protein FJO69_02855 [[Mycoplasma] falconis]|uniref:Uncharacterized protein n=1 Tax=[Mycoplasma] falconis TaxID=92403 RepID=A0A501X7R6_9BACT|nr:hypothetical protein FJO69_02855 [[Mycoplasma] falconis]
MKVKEKKANAKNNFLNIIGFLTVASFLIISIVLFLAAAKIFGNLNKGGQIACYVFGAIFGIIFILIITKIVLIYKSEKKYDKSIVDTNALFYNQPLTESEAAIHNAFIAEYSHHQTNRDIYFGYLLTLERKLYKRDNIELKLPELRALVEKMIMATIDEYSFFDVYLAIEFTKGLNKKFVIKSDLKRYKVYFEYIRTILHKADDYIHDTYINI